MPIVDVHTHMFTRRWMELLRSSGSPYRVVIRPDGQEEVYRGETPVVLPQPGHFDYGQRIATMDEVGIDISRHKPIDFEELEDLEGLNFDLIVTLSPPAHHKALDLTRTVAADVEYWPTVDPTGIEGSREQKLDAYREVRDTLMAQIRKRFGRAGGGNE